MDYLQLTPTPRVPPPRWVLVDDAAALAEHAADLVLEVLRSRREPVLVLPTGRTPEGMYARLVARSRPEDWARARVFNLDEYAGVAPEHPGSYAAFMRRHLFEHVAIEPSRCHAPAAAALGESQLQRACVDYERLLARHGPPDLAVLGLGHNGHIAFNEPGSPFDSRTRLVTLDASTRLANASAFPGDEPVPDRALTMGIASILEARRILVLVSGASKAAALARLARGVVDERFPASALHLHPAVTVLMDRAAASSPAPPPAAFGGPPRP